MHTPTLEDCVDGLRDVGVEDVPLDVALFDLEIDSLMILEWLYSLEDEYGFEVDQELVEALETATVVDTHRYVVTLIEATESQRGTVG